MQNNLRMILLPCSGVELADVPELIPLLPLGHVKSRKGDFFVDEESFRLMCKGVEEHGVDVVIDYEHQTLTNEQAPAAGWIKELVLSDGAICGRVEWTTKAAQYLKNREYRYISPVIFVRKSDRKAAALMSAALTNIPAIDGMIPIVNSAKFEGGYESMDFMKQLAALLGLPETATEEEILAAVKGKTGEIETLKAASAQAGEVVANKTVLSLLQLKDDASTADVTAKIAGLQNPANFVPVEQYNLLACKLRNQESGSLVELALKDGKITPAQKPWAEEYVKADPDGFKAFLDKAVPVVPMAQVALSSKPAERAETISSEIRNQLGISKEDLEKFGKDDL